MRALHSAGPTSAIAGAIDIFHWLMAILKDARELVIIVASLAIGTAWVINIFATRDELARLDCYTKVNIKMLQATGSVNFAEQNLRQARLDKREQEKILNSLRTSPAPAAGAMINATQDRLDQLIETEKTLAAMRETEKDTSTRALAALTNRACDDRDSRKVIDDRLARGEL